jgi:carbon dioxide concentrating mechanism protein CcmL
MKLGRVIGRVTLSQTVPSLLGARWLIVSPFSRENFEQESTPHPGPLPVGRGEGIQLSKEPSLVIYDDLGGGVGQTVGYVEGREAAEPFEKPPPIDAINAALVDEIFYSPLK